MSFRPSITQRAMALLFFVIALVASIMTASGVSHLEGDLYLLVLMMAIIPWMITIVAGLRLATLWTRQITLEANQLDHRQLFKNYRVPYAGIRRVEVQRRADDEVGTLRILWSGPRFYLDAQSINGWEDFLSAFEPHIKGGFREVKSFEAVDD